MGNVGELGQAGNKSCSIILNHLQLDEVLSRPVKTQSCYDRRLGKYMSGLYGQKYVYPGSGALKVKGLGYCSQGEGFNFQHFQASNCGPLNKGDPNLLRGWDARQKEFHCAVNDDSSYYYVIGENML